jgi:hypothetical protein
VNVVVNADAGESIAYVRVEVNGSPEDNEDVQPPAQQWENTLTQKGQYPGDNRVVVTVTDSKGVDSRFVHQWS